MFFIITTIILLILLIIAVFYLVKLSQIIFLYEEELTEMSNELLIATEHLEDITRFNVLMEVPRIRQYVIYSFDQIKYCRLLLLNVVQKSRLLITRKYETKVETLPPKRLFVQELIDDGVYNEEEEGDIYISGKPTRE